MDHSNPPALDVFSKKDTVDVTDLAETSDPLPATVPAVASKEAGILVLMNVIFLATLLVHHAIRRLFCNGTWPSWEALGLRTDLISFSALLSLTLLIIVAKGIGNSRTAKSTLVGIIVALAGLQTFQLTGLIQRRMIPQRPQRQVFDRADLYFLSALKLAVRDQLKQETERRQFDSSPRGHTTLRNRLELIQSGLISWTESRVIDTRSRRLALQDAAFQIAPDSFERSVRRGLVQRQSFLRSQIQNQLARVKLELDQAQAQLKKAQTELGQQIQSQKKSTQQAPGELETKDLRQTAAEQTEFVSTLAIRRAQMTRRLEFLQLAAEFPDGINSMPGIRLPIVVENGDEWLSQYYVVSGVFMLQLFVMLILVLFFSSNGMPDCRRHHAMATALFWLAHWLPDFFV